MKSHTLSPILPYARWEQYNLTISIAIFDDRVEISSPDALPPQLPLDR